MPPVTRIRDEFEPKRGDVEGDFMFLDRYSDRNASPVANRHPGPRSTICLTKKNCECRHYRKSPFRLAGACRAVARSAAEGEGGRSSVNPT